MSGLTPITAAALSPASPAPITAPAADFTPLPPASETAFAVRIPPAQFNDVGRIDNAPTLGDRVLAGLGRISSSFASLDTMMAQAMPGGATPGIQPGMGGMAAGSGATTQPGGFQAIPDHMKAQDIPSVMKSVEEQGVAMYNQQFAREVKFTAAEFEAHIVTVASQNMSSTLKSLLSQGG